MYLINNEILKSNLIALILETGRLILTSLNLPLTYRYQDEFYRYVSIIPFILSKEPPEPFGVETNTM